MRKILLIVLLGLSLLGNVFLAWRLVVAPKTANTAEVYPLLARRLWVEEPNDILIDFAPLRLQIQDYLEKSGIGHSFYFEYLPTGTSIRDGENKELVGASLMKIPVVMDLFKAAEQGKIDLDKPVTVELGDVSLDEQFGNPNSLKEGEIITLREAAKTTLEDSDNTAAQIVFRSTTDLLTVSDHAINNLDIEKSTRNEGQGDLALIGARAYSSILKCLYFSCFLSPEHSQEILTLLTETTSANRLKAGVPDNVNVAHKFGSFSDITQSDCGIIYLEKRHYLLCLMMETNNSVDKYFVDISRMTYEYISAKP